MATAAYSRIVTSNDAQVATDHPEQVYAPLGGRWAKREEVQRLIDQLTALARRYGFPDKPTDAQRIGFDRDAAIVVREGMDLSWAEAGARDVWSFVAIVVLPHLTMWRFGTRNAERWVASDLTRHTWSRLWWQAVVFETDLDLLRQLGESDLNQLLERRSIGGDPRLVCSLGRAVLAATDTEIDRRALIRDATARLRRLLAFVDPRATTDEQLLRMCSFVTSESVSQLANPCSKGLARHTSPDSAQRDVND